MSQSSGFSGLPPKIAGSDGFPPSRAELKAKIIAIRGEARAQNIRERMEGDIIRHNRDGTTDIKTPRGEITVELPAKDRPPEGSRLEIDIPKGHPPRHIMLSRMRDDTPRTANTTESRTDAGSDNRKAGKASEAHTRKTAQSIRHQAKISAETDLSLRTQTGADQTRPQSDIPQTPPLRSGDFLRLTPLPPYETIMPLPVIATDIITSFATRAAMVAYHTLATAAMPDATVILTTAAPGSNASASNNYSTSHSANTTPLQANTVMAGQISLDMMPYALHSALAAPPDISAAIEPVQLMVSQSVTHAAMAARAAHIMGALSVALPVQSSGLPSGIIPSGAPDNSTAPMAGKHISPLIRDIRIHTIAPHYSLTGDTNLPSPAAATQGSAQFINKNITGNVTRGAPGLPLSGIPLFSHLLTVRDAVTTQAVVAGQNAAGLPVLSLYIPQSQTWQNFTIPVQPANMTQGQIIDIVPHMSLSSAASAAASAMPMAAALSAMPPFIPYEFFSNFSWPPAEDILRNLQQAVPQAAQTLMNITPNAALPARFPAAALLFMAVIRGGDLSGWLGDKNIEALKRLGKDSGLSRMARDMAGIQRSAADTISQEWRALAMPLVYEGELSKLILYYRHDRQEAGQGDSRRATRFVFDLSLSNMGLVQIDGLHQKLDSRQNRMDLIIRTLKPISADMRKAMRALYSEALQQANAIGDIGFQNEKEKFVTIDMPKSALRF